MAVSAEAATTDIEEDPPTPRPASGAGTIMTSLDETAKPSAAPTLRPPVAPPTATLIKTPITPAPTVPATAASTAASTASKDPLLNYTNSVFMVANSFKESKILRKNAEPSNTTAMSQRTGLFKNFPTYERVRSV